MADRLQKNIEIIVIDDASDKTYREQNEIAKTLADQYIQLTQNIGRSAIRNRFVEYAKYAFMLYLDCDVMPASDRYLTVYTSLAHKDAYAVWYGGRIYEDKKPAKDQLLRWTYGRKIESRPSVERSRDPYRSFHSNNFMVRKELLQRFPFDESLRGYGHEDTMFTFVMRQNTIPIVHLDNPVINMHLESNARFLDMTDEGLVHLKKIAKIPGMEEHVRMLGIYSELKDAGLDKLLFPWVRNAARKLLEKGFSWMWLLQVYKLAQYQLKEK